MILPSRSFAFFKPNMSQLVPEPAMFGYKIVLIINFILLSKQLISFFVLAFASHSMIAFECSAPPKNITS